MVRSDAVESNAPEPRRWLHAVASERLCWRYVPPCEASGAEHMAIDRWLLDECVAGRLVGALRFYRWSPPAVSLGYHQRSFPESWRRLEWRGEAIELVRRPTGGRAVLHAGDLTYAVVGASFSSRRSRAYREVCQFLIDGLGRLGIELHYGSAAATMRGNPNCFALATGADLLLPNGQKLIGSAQAIRRRVVLQHGSIALEPDRGLFRQVFQTAPPDVRSVPLTGPLSERCDRLMDVLAAAAGRCFGVDLHCQPLTPTEWQTVRALAIASAVDGDRAQPGPQT